VALRAFRYAIAATSIAAAGIAGGCSDASKNLTTADTIAALRSAGVTTAVKNRFGQIAARGSGAPWLAPLYAVRLPSASDAKRTYERGYSHAAIAQQAAEARKRPGLYAGLLPEGFPAGVKTERVCNVIVVANNPWHRTILDHEFDRALELLRAKCE
jgi:hypothetical protein